MKDKEITLRQYYAAQAMSALIQANMKAVVDGYYSDDSSIGPELIAIEACEYADALIRIEKESANTK